MLRILRLDHSIKHIFIVVGYLLGVASEGVIDNQSLVQLAVIIMGAIVLASGNYAINEYLDREFDKFHPIKKTRIAVVQNITPSKVLTIWLICFILGQALMIQANLNALYLGLLFSINGLAYNVKPIRLKDRPWIDSASEAFNLNIRVTWGLTAVAPTVEQIFSIQLMIGLFSTGLFLMTAKRFAEYLRFKNSNATDVLEKYRAVFKYYSLESLGVVAVSCALIATSMLTNYVSTSLEIHLFTKLIIYLTILTLFTLYFYETFKGSIAINNSEISRHPIILAVILIAISLVFIVEFIRR